MRVFPKFTVYILVQAYSDITFGENIMKAIFRTMLFVALIVFVSTACTVPFAPRLVRGSGDIIVEERDVSDFEEILVTGAGRVIVTQGGSESLIYRNR